MEVIIFEKESYYKMQREMMNMFKQALKEAREESKKKNEPQYDWISEAEAKELLGIRSKSKMQQLRDHQEIGFSKHGRIIRYSRKSIMEFLERNTK